MNEEKRNAIVASLKQAFADNHIALTEVTLSDLAPKEEEDEARQ